MSKSKKVVRKVAVSLVGYPIIIVGIALLVLPGPGLLVILVGLLIISTEFDWAKKHVTTLRARLDDVTKAAKKVGGGSGSAKASSKSPKKTQADEDKKRPGTSN